MASGGSPSIDPRTPVLVGVGQHLNRDQPGLEPVELMAEAVRLAVEDSGVPGAATAVDTVAVVPTFSWRYRDPGRLVAERIGARGARTWYATVGGNTPQLLVNRMASAIREGSVDLGVVCGGEASRSRRAAKAAGEDYTWTRQGEDVTADWLDETPFVMSHPAEVAKGIVMPTQVYPLFETALWHDSGRTLDEHLLHVGELWAGFSRVAAKNPYAWRQEEYTAAEITTPAPDNRLVGFPYTKRMVSNPDVDMAAAMVMCSYGRARELGVAADRIVFLHSGTDGVDRSVSERPDHVSSAAIRVAGARALELAGVTVDEVEHLDVYSCFPSAVQVAVRELGVPEGRQLTVYGGLSFAGGPWNNPVGHAIASMVEVLRADPGSRGLVTANGGHIDKHSFGVYSTEPPAEGFRWEKPQDRIDATTDPVTVEADHVGSATVESWTVMHDRDGVPERAHASCRTPSGGRTWAVSDDADVMAWLMGDDRGGVEVTLGEGGVLHLA